MPEIDSCHYVGEINWSLSIMDISYQQTEFICNVILHCGNQWRACIVGVTWSRDRTWATRRAAAFWTRCKGDMETGSPASICVTVVESTENQRCHKLNSDFWSEKPTNLLKSPNMVEAVSCDLVDSPGFLRRGRTIAYFKVSGNRLSWKVLLQMLASLLASRGRRRWTSHVGAGSSAQSLAGACITMCDTSSAVTSVNSDGLVHGLFTITGGDASAVDRRMLSIFVWKNSAKSSAVFSVADVGSVSSATHWTWTRVPSSHEHWLQ